ncbi:MAG: iron ABC transporter permease [Corynebacterium sp.]|nr:iron ABC transporter permease [Corynebacterium sp.]
MGSRSIRLSAGGALTAAIGFLGVFFLWPVAAMLMRGFNSSVLAEVLTTTRTWRIIWQTIWMAAAGTLGSLIAGVPGAYVLYRLTFPGRTLVRMIATVPFVLPTVVVGVAFNAVFRPTGGAHSPAGIYAFTGFDSTTAAVVAAMVFFNFSVVVRTVGTLWERLDPRQEDAAATLGATPLRRLLTVTAPQLSPAIAASAGLVFLFCSTAYGIVLTLGRPGFGTVETEMWVQTATFINLDKAAAFSVIQCVIVIAAVVISSQLSARYERQLGGGTVAAHPVRRRDIPLLGAVGFFIVAVIVVPLGNLVLASLAEGGRAYRFLSTSGAGFVGGVTAWEGLANSLITAVFSAVIALTVGTVIALTVSRSPRSRAGRLLVRSVDMLSLTPLGVSAVTVGFGYFISLVGILPRPVLVPLAQAVVALPLVTRALVPVLRAIDTQLREAAATLGASPWRVLLTIDLSLARRGLGIAAGFALAMSVGEFGATSFLASPQYVTLPVLIARLLGRPGADNYEMAMAASVILACTAALLMVAATAIGADRRAESAQVRAGGVVM